jgi:hypothetical protein
MKEEAAGLGSDYANPTIPYDEQKQREIDKKILAIPPSELDDESWPIYRGAVQRSFFYPQWDAQREAESARKNEIEGIISNTQATDREAMSRKSTAQQMDAANRRYGVIADVTEVESEQIRQYTDKIRLGEQILSSEGELRSELVELMPNAISEWSASIDSLAKLNAANQQAAEAVAEYSIRLGAAAGLIDAQISGQGAILAAAAGPNTYLASAIGVQGGLESAALTAAQLRNIDARLAETGLSDAQRKALESQRRSLLDQARSGGMNAIAGIYGLQQSMQDVPYDERGFIQSDYFQGILSNITGTGQDAIAYMMEQGVLPASTIAQANQLAFGGNGLTPGNAAAFGAQYEGELPSDPIVVAMDANTQATIENTAALLGKTASFMDQAMGAAVDPTLAGQGVSALRSGGGSVWGNMWAAAGKSGWAAANQAPSVYTGAGSAGLAAAIGAGYGMAGGATGGIDRYTPGAAGYTSNAGTLYE